MPLNESQIAAIETRDRTLLVSAAAGSGKTTTLALRVISSLLDPEHPVSLSRMLIVTFTKAAVGELKDRIRRALTEAIEKNPGREDLARELLLLPAAHIQTIDGFCNDILRRTAADVGLAPNYRVADPAEGLLLADRVMEDLCDGLYEGAFPDVATSEEFAALAECLTGVRSEGDLGTVLYRIYQRTLTSEEGVRSLIPLVERYADPTDFADRSVFGQEIAHRTRELAEEYIRLYEKLAAELRDEGGAPSEKVADLADADVNFLCALAGAGNYRARRDLLLSHAFASFPRITKDKTDLILTAQRVRDLMKGELSDLRDAFYLYTDAEFSDLAAGLYEKGKTLVSVLTRFDETLTAEKRARGMVEYADMERYTYAALWHDGELTDFARSVAAGFDAVYIDEYQDVNRLQNKIFEAVSRPDNRFMVGDIKQSIYGFRSARPEIFAACKNAYPPLGTPGDSPAASLFMSENYRSDAEVIDATNEVFDTFFGLLGDSIGYCPADRLTFAKGTADRVDPTPHPVSLLLSETPPRNYSIPEEEGEEIDRRRIEAQNVATRIKAILAEEKNDKGEPYRPCDITLLFRNTQSQVQTFVDVLEQNGIRCAIEDKKDFFYNAEVLLALSLLYAIDNPRRDVYLAGLLCSPIAGFSPSDLVAMKQCADGALYDGLLAYLEEHPEDERARDFVRMLTRYREMAEGMPVDRLLAILYRETGLEALAKRTGGADHLARLYEYARRFEADGFGGLYAFLAFISEVIESGTKLENKGEVAADENAVRLMTIHSSKGMQFPVVFLVELGAQLSRSRDDAFVLEEDFGLSIKLRDQSGIASVKNPVSSLIVRRLGEAEYLEELRVLYVAMTRAQERLYLSGRVLGSADATLEKNDLCSSVLSPYRARRMGSFLEMLLLAGRSIPKTRIPYVPKEEQPAPSPTENTEAKEEKADNPADDLAALFSDRFSFHYPNAALTELPEKLSVSYLYPTVLDGTEEADDSTALEEKTLTVPPLKSHTTPRFLSGEDPSDAAKRGIATHTFMQFFDPARLAKRGAAAELDRLKSELYLSENDAALVRMDEIELFRRSDLLIRMRSAKALYREFRFHVRLPARDFTADPEKRAALGDTHILVQGVIDCVIENADGSLALIDYKTDRLTREEREDKERARQTLTERHALQLSYYRAAVEAMFGKAPKTTEIYSLALGDTVCL